MDAWWLLYALMAWAALKAAHSLGLTPWPHSWSWSHCSYERKVAVDTRTNQWVDQSRPYNHFRCRYCDAWKDV